MFEFFDKAIEIVQAGVEWLEQTTQTIDGVTFEDLSITQYLGYAHYFMGTVAYSSLMLMIQAIAGINIAFFIMNAIGKLKNFLPW